MTCVISCLSKLFLLILNDCLSFLVNTHDIVSKIQIGFQKNNRLTEHIFTLKTIINMSTTPLKEKFMQVL